jgi:putative endopeptidase
MSRCVATSDKRRAVRWTPLAAAVCFACSGGGPLDVPAGIDPDAMDLSGDPCTDFYQYACGTWLSQHPLSSTGSEISRQDTAFYAVETDEASILSDASDMSVATTLTQTFNAECLSAGGTTGMMQALTSALQAIDAVTDAGMLPQAVAAVHDVGGDAFFDFRTQRDLMAPGEVIGFLGQGGIGLPDPSYYDSASIIAAYRMHIDRLQGLAGVPPPALDDTVLSIETALAHAMLSADALRDPVATYHPQALAGLDGTWPHTGFSAYLSAEGVDAGAQVQVNVEVPTFAAAVDTLLAQTDLEALKRYLRWRAIEAAAPLLNDAIVAEEYAFHEGTFAGFTTPLPRKEYCTRLTLTYLGWSVSQLYVRRYAGLLRGSAQPMVDAIHAALKDDLSQTPWLDEPTRAVALQKVDAVQIGVSAPVDFSPYVTDLTSLPSELDSAAVALVTRSRRRELALLGQTDSRLWQLTPTTVNAFYLPALNAINIAAAIMAPPRYKTDWPDAVNYGALGSVVGHELTHGFDDSGRKYDASGALNDWWSPASKSQFDTRAQCLVSQYGAIAGQGGTHIDGQLTLGENIADTGGVKLALAALKPTGQKTGSFTDTQVFFIAYAQVWCQNLAPAEAQTLLKVDPHAPPSARVNAVLADTPDFAQAFSCKPGTALAPANACGVW